jgi:hypothetical protein
MKHLDKILQNNEDGKFGNMYSKLSLQLSSEDNIVIQRKIKLYNIENETSLNSSYIFSDSDIGSKFFNSVGYGDFGNMVMKSPTINSIQYSFSYNRSDNIDLSYLTQSKLNEMLLKLVMDYYKKIIDISDSVNSLYKVFGLYIPDFTVGWDSSGIHSKIYAAISTLNLLSNNLDDGNIIILINPGILHRYNEVIKNLIYEVSVEVPDDEIWIFKIEDRLTYEYTFVERVAYDSLQPFFDTKINHTSPYNNCIRIKIADV